MQRYWELKSQVMDTILFYRFGDWYVLYYDDLEIANKHIDIIVTPHTGSNQVGFKSYAMQRNVQIMTGLGYKVAVAE